MGRKTSDPSHWDGRVAEFNPKAGLPWRGLAQNGDPVFSVPPTEETKREEKDDASLPFFLSASIF